MTKSNIPLWRFRLARVEDAAILRDLIAASVRGLSRNDYTDMQMAGAVGTALGLDTQLIADGTYYVVECAGADAPGEIVGCGGWSARRTLCCGDDGPGRDASLLDPTRDAAKIRAIFVHSLFARRGLGTAILHFVEQEAMRAGFRLLEMGATVTGAPLYAREGYREVERMEIPLQNGACLPVIRMSKEAVEQAACNDDDVEDKASSRG